MIAIAESGSTKTDWLILDQSNTAKSQVTVGFNPHIIGSDFVQKQIESNLELAQISDQIQALHFYGAGCSSPYLCRIIATGLKAVFRHAEIQVHHDMLGAARSTWNGRPALTCILGTGSNCCFYDGKKLHQSHPSLGYLIGDEGSGRDMGGSLMKSVLYKTAPEHIIELFLKQHNPEEDDLITRLYSQDRPNQYLASFAPFIHEHRNDAFVRELILSCFRKFRDTHITSYAEWQNLECHFIGSIAMNFKEELDLVLSERGIQLGQIIQKPIDRLAKYHLNQP